MVSRRYHSQEYLGKQRDFWWNKDFIQLMAQRWDLRSVQSILDVGSGLGHWGFLLYPFLGENAKLIGVEPEAEWRKIAEQKAMQFQINEWVNFVDGTAEAIPFPDHCFDMVTCQTVLIHVADPMIALTEMIRVLKPGGLLVAVEPNNMVNFIVLNNLIWDNSAEEIAALIKFQIICERGRQALQEGNIMRGDLLPTYFSALKLKNINSYLSDKADFLIPPYDSMREKILVESSIDACQSEIYVWNKTESQHYFSAGGGREAEFPEYWELVKKQLQVYLNGFNEKNLYSPGGALMYLTSGRK